MVWDGSLLSRERLSSVSSGVGIKGWHVRAGSAPAPGWHRLPRTFPQNAPALSGAAPAPVAGREEMLVEKRAREAGSGPGESQSCASRCLLEKTALLPPKLQGLRVQRDWFDGRGNPEVFCSEHASLAHPTPYQASTLLLHLGCLHLFF